MGTGPTKEYTRKTIVGLEKQSKKTGKKAWKKIAEELSKPSRRRASVNIYEMNKVAEKQKGKIILVPGKVLATGEPIEGLKVACLDCSEKAREKIEKAKGKVLSFEETYGLKASDMVIMK